MGLLLRHRWLFYFRQVLPGTGGYCLDSAEVLYPHRRVAAGGGPVAQLANEVPSPSPGDGLSGVRECAFQLCHGWLCGEPRTLLLSQAGYGTNVTPSWDP